MMQKHVGDTKFPRVLSMGHFVLSGEFDPDDITRQLEIEPSWTRRIGEPGPWDGWTRPLRVASWYLACGEDDFGDVSDQVAALCVRLRGKTALVSSLSRQFSGEFNLVAYLDGNYPGFFLTQEMTRELADLGVWVQCTYVYAPQQNQDE